MESFAEANIPPIYWFLKIEDFNGPKQLAEVIEEFRSKPDEWIRDGQMLVLVGNYGTGKTTALCQILKLSILNNREAYYTTLSELVQYLTDFAVQKDFWNFVSRRDLLVIDEIDDRHFSKSEDAQKLFGSTFEKVLRYRIQNGLPTLMASNNSSLEEVFEGQYKRVLDSLLNKAKTITCMGKDNRKI